MKRDWEIIRSVLEEVEGLEEQQFQGTQYMYDQNSLPDEVVKVRHLLLLRDAGFVKSASTNTISIPLIIAPELTWQGHELLDTIRSKTVWAKVKTMAKDKGLELTFDAVKALGKVALDQVLSNGS